ncbi:transporter [Burkholderia multivorans]|uniref:Transporter n=2 Tax=Burkholderia multivorans TaxID=87883 RepID=A0AB37ASI9_9BURK|nr:transporter [Burkholderia multivorans]PRE52115.1 transporter [Burkholderia multivorans]
MNVSARCRIAGAAFAVAIATFTICANAQTEMRLPVDPAVQKVAATTQRPRHRTDRTVERDVRHALMRQPHLDDSAIRIRARHGVVTLTGSVPERPQVSRAGNAARLVGGVRSVSNRLTVRAPGRAH